MAEVGELTWIAEIREIAQSKREASQMNEGLEDLANQARQTEAAMNEVGDTSGGLSDTFGGLNTQSGFLIGGLSLLGGELFMLVGRMLGVTGAATTLTGAIKGLYAWVAAGGISGALSTASGYLSAFAGWLAAGSIGALAFAAGIGALIGLTVTWILHITGVLDVIGELGAMLSEMLPGWARDALLTVISIFAGGLAVLGGLIAGFVGSGGDLEAGLRQADEVLQLFVGAWERVWGKVISRAKESIAAITSLVQGFAEDIAEHVSGAVRGIWNTAIPDQVTLPEITVGGQHVGVHIPHIGDVGGTLPEVTLGGDVIDLPQLQSGGFIEEGGAAVLHQGEMVLPADVSRSVIDAIRRLGSGAAGAAAAGVTVVIEQQLIEIGDQQIDASKLDRRTLEDLADLIAGKQGDELAALV